MNTASLRSDAMKIVHAAITAASPENSVKSAIGTVDLRDDPIAIVAIGKAAWQMANAAYSRKKDIICDGRKRIHH